MRKVFTKRCIGIAVAIFLAVLIPMIIVGCYFLRDSAGRSWRMLIYLNAMTYWEEQEYGNLPASLDELERAYNTREDAGYKIPLDDMARQPIHRPMHRLQGGPFLYLIEQKPKKWYAFGRWVIYACPDGSERRCEFAPPWELDDRVTQDDELRASNKVSPTTSEN